MGTVGDLLDLVRLYWPLLLGNSLEWYEFAVYGYMESYMEQNFFEGSAIATWAGFTATFLARPVGGLFLGTIGDLFGRRIAVIMSVIGMLIGTAGQGLLPCPRNHRNSPWVSMAGVVALFCLRLLQGLCTGGEISSVSTYIVEVGSQRSLGRCTALLSVTVNLGFMLARVVIWTLQSHLGDSAMLQWGWRVPFLLALLPGSVAVAGRICLRESGEFVREHEEADSEEDGMPGHSPWQHMQLALQSHFPAILVGIFGVCNIAVLQYGGLIWTNSFLKKHGSPTNTVMTAGVCSRLIQMCLAILVGWLADVHGLGLVTLAGAWMLMSAGLPMFIALESDPANPVNVCITYGIMYALMASLCGSVVFMCVAELFPTSVRNLGVGISFNVGFCFFGGFAPVLAEASLKWTPHGPGLLLSAAGAVTFLTVLASVKLQEAGKVQLAHVRPVPYLGTWAHGSQNAEESLESLTGAHARMVAHAGES